MFNHVKCLITVIRVTVDCEWSRWFNPTCSHDCSTTCTNVWDPGDTFFKAFKQWQLNVLSQNIHIDLWNLVYPSPSMDWPPKKVSKPQFKVSGWYFRSKMEMLSSKGPLNLIRIVRRTFKFILPLIAKILPLLCSFIYLVRSHVVSTRVTALLAAYIKSVTIPGLSRKACFRVIIPAKFLFTFFF